MWSKIVIGLILVSSLIAVSDCAEETKDIKSAAVPDKPQAVEEAPIVKTEKTEKVEKKADVLPPPQTVNKDPPKLDEKEDTVVVQKHDPSELEIPSSIITGFYVFVALGFVAIIYITFRSFR